MIILQVQPRHWEINITAHSIENYSFNEVAYMEDYIDHITLQLQGTILCESSNQQETTLKMNAS